MYKMNGRKPYEGICTEAQMLSLIENIDNTKDVEWSEYVVDGEELSYPMWKAVAAAEGDTYEDFVKYFDAAKKKTNSKDVIVSDDDKVGIVEPDDDFDDQTEVDVFTESASPLIFNGEDLVSKVRRLMGNNHVVSDKSGVVKPKLDGMPSKTTKQITDVDSTKENTPDVDVAKKAAKAGVGVVKATDAFTTQTKVDVTAGDGLKKGPAQLSDMTGVVKSSAVGLKGSTKAEIKVDATKSTIEIKDAPKDANPKVGMIKPDSDIKPNPKPITFKDAIKNK
jgi:hypothetical protein